MSDPILPLAVWEEGTLQNDVPANDNALRVEAMRRPVLGVEDSPITTNDGDVYIVGASPSGDFATFDPDDLTIYRGGTWYAWAPVEGMDINGYVYTGSGGWTASGGGSTVGSVNGKTGVVIVPVPVGVACSDETTALTAGAAKVTFRMPFAMTVTGVRASLTTAQATNGAGGIFTVDINEAGVSILSTKITIDNTEKTSVTAAAPPVVSDSSLADDAEMTIDIDQIGDGTAKGLKVWIIGYPL